MKLNLGAGNIIMEGYINHDLIKHRKEIDIAFDLNEKEWRRIFNYPSFQFEMTSENYYEEIRAWDVLEHLDDIINFMDNCWRLLKVDGILDMKVCGWQNPNAHVDITHKRPGLDIRSLDYFDSSTEIGTEYSYYTKKKWKILEKSYDRKNNILIKLTPIK